MRNAALVEITDTPSQPGEPRRVEPTMVLRGDFTLEYNPVMQRVVLPQLGSIAGPIRAA